MLFSIYWYSFVTLFNLDTLHVWFRQAFLGRFFCASRDSSEWHLIRSWSVWEVKQLCSNSSWTEGGIIYQSYHRTLYYWNFSESSGPCIAMYLLKVQHSCLGTSCDSSHNSRSGEKLVAVVHLYTLIAWSLGL